MAIAADPAPFLGNLSRRQGWRPKLLWEVLKEAASEWSSDKASRLAAALSYYTIFSIAPLLLISIAVAGFVFGREAAANEIYLQLRGLFGDSGAQAIQAMVEAADKTGTGVLATVLGLATLLFGASGAFGQLQDALNTIWEVKPKPGQGIKGIVRLRALSFSMVLVIAFMLLVSLVLSAALAALGKFLGDALPIPAAVMQTANTILGFGIISLLFALIFKVLPDIRIAWRDVWIGAMFTALLFSIGRLLIGLYLGRSSVTSSYGAAGSLVVILLWVYYSSQILLFGAEFTKSYSVRMGSRYRPSSHAEPMTGEARAEQGMVPDKDGPHDAPRAGGEKKA
jgi:membrane protein